MESDLLPAVLLPTIQPLNPYLKKREDIVHIRRILASHLGVHFGHRNGPSKPLSLTERPRFSQSITYHARGLRKEYLHQITSNVKATNEYALMKEGREQERDSVHLGASVAQDSPDTTIRQFLDLVRIRQRHERLCVLQDYIHKISLKSTDSSGHFEASKFMGGLSPPQFLGTALDVTSQPLKSTGYDLQELVAQLEKTVLKAKLQLRSEQNMLFKVQSEKRQKSVVSGVGRLEALGTARNELINWIELNLEKDEPSSPSPNESLDRSELIRRDDNHTNEQVTLIQEQYSRYLRGRRALATAINTASSTSTHGEMEHNQAPSPVTLRHTCSAAPTHSIHPYLEELVLVASQQKTAIQQKSYLTVMLAKQLKDANNVLSRLANESHLLPAYPLLSSSIQQNFLGKQHSFGDEIAHHETSDSSHRVQDWVHAAKAAGNDTKHSVSERLEEGGVIILEAQETLLGLLGLIGSDNENGVDGCSGDIWAKLDGKMGAIGEKQTS